MTRFEQQAYGEQEHGQTPAGMFLETWNSYGRPEVGRLRRSRKTGELVTDRVSAEEAEVLGWALGIVDGHRTAYEEDGPEVASGPWPTGRGVRLMVAPAHEESARFVQLTFGI